MVDKYLSNESIKHAFNKDAKPIFDCQLPVHIFGTGSEGNSVFFKHWNLLVDIGLPYKRYQEYDENFFMHCDKIIVSHEHGDHLNPSTLIKAMTEYPHLKVITSKFMYNQITKPTFKAVYSTQKDENGKTLKQYNLFGKEEIIYNRDENGEKIVEKSPYKEKFEALKHRFILIDNEQVNLTTTYKTRTGSINLTVFPVKHGNIINIALQIQDMNTGFNVLYASDLDNLGGKASFMDCDNKVQHASGLPQSTTFDFILLEANYDKQIITDWLELHTSPSDKARAAGNMRHISENEAFEYVKKHLAENGIFIPIHASRTFGTLIQM